MKVTASAPALVVASFLAAGGALAQTPEGPASGAPAPAAVEPSPAVVDPAASPTQPAGAEGEPAAPPPPPPALLVAPPAPVPQPPPYHAADEEEEPDDGSLGSHQSHVFVGAGVRTSFISSAGFEPFSEQDALPQFSLYAGGVLFTSGDLSLVALGGWDYGQTQSKARGADTQLDVHRLWLGAEGRYHVWRRLYGFGRLAPAAIYDVASLHDGVAQSDRAADSWLVGADASVGAACELFGRKSGSSRRARGWLLLAGGYGLTTSSDLSLEVEDGAAPIRTAALDLGGLTLSGPFVRVDFSLSF